MPGFSKIFSNTAVPVAGKLVSVLISIVLVKLLSTNLGVDGFGYYIIIFQFVAIFSSVSDFGIYVTSVREMAACEKSEVPRILGNVLGMRLVSAAASMLIAGVVVAIIPTYDYTPIVIGVWLATSMVVINSITGCMNSVLQVNYQIRFGTLAVVTGKLARLCWIVFILVLLIPGSVTGFSMNVFSDPSAAGSGPVTLVIYLVVAGFTFGSLVEFLVTYYYARKLTDISFRFEMGYWKPFLIKTAPYGIAVFLGAAYFQVDTLMLSLLQGPEAVGIYAVAMRLLENGAFIPVVFVNALLPALALGLQKGDMEQVKGLLQKSWLFMLSISLALALLATGYAVPLTLLFSSRDFVSSSMVPMGSDVAIQISVWALLFSSLNRVFVFTSLAMGGQLKILVINAVGVTFNVVTNLIFIPKYGMIAAAITTVVSEGLVLGLNFGVVWGALRFRPPVTASLGMIGAAVLVFGLSNLAFHWLMNPESITAMLLVSSASCVVYLFVLKTTVLRTYFSTNHVFGIGRWL